ncbi:tetratricopeptide repeat protein [Winogradskyella sp.]|uniref:tetratricopeptide repeat protein n=1 Tax=Winogradskyella sp. TaxID=1883156 RepID=UPI00262AB978|nr:tetratricopeptide repeat protein [Winogradskyella sp.]
MKSVRCVLFVLFCFSCHTHAQNFEDFMSRGDSLLAKNYLEADSLYTLAEQLAHKNKDERQKALILTRKARISTNKTEYDKSLKLLQEALSTFRTLKDTLLMAQAEQNMGLVYRYTKDYRQAAIQNKKALDLWKTQNDSTLIGIGYRDLGVIYRKLGQLDKAREHYEIAASYFNPKKNRDQLLTLRGNFSTLELTEGNYKAAIALNKMDLLYIKSKQKWRSLSTRYRIIAHSYLKLNDYEMALYYADSAVAAAEHSNMLDAKMKALLTKSNALSKNGDYKSAYRNYRSYKKLSDSAFSIDKAKEVARIITVNNYENQKTLDSLHFASEKAILQQSIQKQTTQKRLYFVSGLLAVIVAFSLWFGNKQRKKLAEQKLKEKNLQQKILEDELRTTEREATRLIEEAKHRTAYKQTILEGINAIFESQPKNYKKEFSQLRYKLSEDIRHESESLFNYKEVNVLQNKLDEKLLTHYPTLTKSERQMCSYVIAGLSIKEIAELKQTTLTAVKAMRYRIRKKLGLQSGDELQTFIESI